MLGSIGFIASKKFVMYIYEESKLLWFNINNLYVFLAHKYI